MALNAPTSGYKLARIQSKATTNALLQSPNPATLYGYSLHNGGASAAFIKVYDKASAPVPGTDVPWFTISIPAGGTATMPLPAGLPSLKGLGFAVTGGAGDGDSSNALLDGVTGFFLYA